MPSQYIHAVLTSGDSVAVGTNFLSEGHSKQIMKVIIKEGSFRDHEKFPGMLEMLAILMLKASERCMITPDFVRLLRVFEENHYQGIKPLLWVLFFDRSHSFRIKLVIEWSICIMKPGCDSRKESKSKFKQLWRCDSRQRPKLKLVITTLIK